MRALTLAVLLILVAGCTSNAPDTRQEAPSLLLQDVDGAVVDLHQWFGSPILLEVFGVHCGSCRSMMPELLDYYDAFGANNTVRMLSVDLGPNFDGLGARNEDEVRAWRAEFGAEWTFALDDANGQTNEKYPHVARPTTYLIAPDATIAWMHGGYASVSSLKTETDRILAS